MTATNPGHPAGTERVAKTGLARGSARRLVSLDAFRGITIAGMVLVNNPGSWSHVYAPLRHAAWHGCTPTDLIFPFFLFIVGVAMAFSLPRHLEGGHPGAAFWKRVLQRSAMLIALGLVLNAVLPIADAIRQVGWGPLTSIRLPGVLQRIGLVYLLACCAVVCLPTRARDGLMLLILIGTPVLMMTLGPSPAYGEGDNLARSIDRALLPDAMLYTGSPTDPEGLLGTLTALVTALIGYRVGLWLACRSELGVRDATRLAGLGLALLIAGLLAGQIVPINKGLWTSSYVLYTAGWACIGLGLCVSWCDVWCGPGRGLAALVGRHAITVFVGSGLLARALMLLPSPQRGVSLRRWFPDQLAGMPISDLNASLVYALLMVVLWVGIAWAMDRRGWVLKV